MFAPLQKLMIEHALYPLMEKRRGNHIREYYRALRQTEAAAPEALHALQRERLEALLLSAQGCGYVLRVGSGGAMRALSVFRGRGVAFGHLYRLFHNGAVEEVRV